MEGRSIGLVGDKGEGTSVGTDGLVDADFVLSTEGDACLVLRVGIAEEQDPCLLSRVFLFLAIDGSLLVGAPTSCVADEMLLKKLRWLARPVDAELGPLGP